MLQRAKKKWYVLVCTRLLHFGYRFSQAGILLVALLKKIVHSMLKIDNAAHSFLCIVATSVFSPPCSFPPD